MRSLVLIALIFFAAGSAEADVNAFWKELGGSASELGISKTRDRDAFNPTIAVGGDGRPVVVYVEQSQSGPLGTSAVVVKRWTGSAWQTLSGANGIGQGRVPQIRIAPNGTIYVAWLQDDGDPLETQVHLLRRTASGTGWQQLGGSNDSGGLTRLQGSIGGARSFSLALMPDGNPIVALETVATAGPFEGSVQIYVKRYNPLSSTWEYLGSDPLTGGGASNARSFIAASTGGNVTHFATSPSLAVRGDGTPLVAFVYSTFPDIASGAFIPENTEIFVTQFSSTSGWTALGPEVPQLDDGSVVGQGGLGGISESAAPSYAPALAVGPANEIWLAWLDGNNVFVRQWTGVSWDELTGSATGAGVSNPSFSNGAPALAVRTNGDPIVVWSSRPLVGAQQIFVKQGHGTFEEMGVDSADGGGISDSPFVDAFGPMIGTPSTGTAGPAVVWMAGADTADLPNGPVQIYLRQFSTATAFRLDVTITGNASSVTSTPIGIDCPSDSCSAEYPSGQAVTLTPVDGPDSVFDRWSGACTGSGACTVRMTAPRSVTASFVASATLSVGKTGTGASFGVVNGTRIACGGDCQEKYKAGTMVTLTVSVPAGTLFDGWGGECAFRGRNTSCALTMDGDRSVTAAFRQRVHRLTYAAAVPAGAVGRGNVGRAFRGTTGCPVGETCVADIDYGAVVGMLAVPEAGNRFLAWSGGACTGSTNPSCFFTMLGNQSTTALFRGVTKITVSKLGNGEGKITGPGLDCGSDCAGEAFTNTSATLRFTPATGTIFQRWEGDACASVTSPTCSFKATNDVQIAARSEKRRHHLRLTVDGMGVAAGAGLNCGGLPGHSDCDEDFDYGTAVALTATPGIDSRFVGWTGCSRLNGSACVVDMTANRAIRARFGVARTLEVFSAGSGSGRITAPTTPPLLCIGNCSTSRLVPVNTSVVLTPRPDAGSSFRWMDGGDMCGGSGDACWAGNLVCSGSGQCSVPMSQNRTAIGRFTLNRHRLTVTRTLTGGRTLSTVPLPEAIDCGPSTQACAITADYGTAVGLQAIADVGFAFARWTGTSPCSAGARATNASCSFTLQGDVTATPDFRERTLVTLTKSGEGDGTVTATGVLSPASVRCGPECDETTFQAFDARAVTLRATPSVGSTFTGFTGACVSNTTTCKFVPSGAGQSVSARFEHQPRSVHVTVRGQGTVTSDRPGCDAAIACTVQGLFDDEVELTARKDDSSNPASALVGPTWTGCTRLELGSCIVRLNSPTSAPAAVALSFSGALLLSLEGDGIGSVTATPPGAVSAGIGQAGHAYPFGTRVTFSRAVGASSVFAGWGGSCAFRGTNSTCVLTFDRSHEVRATFLGPRALVVNKPGRGTGTVTSSPSGIACGADCIETYRLGTVVTLTAAVASGSVFEGFTGCDSNPAPTSCRVTITANRTVETVFNPPGGLSVMVSGNGSVTSGDGLINCGGGATQCEVRYAVGARVVLTPSAGENAFFDRWGGACSAGGGCEVVVSDHIQGVSAIFGAATVLTITFPGQGTGFVDHTGGLTGGTTRCPSGAPCTIYVKPGKSVTLTAGGTSGAFGEWGGDCAGTPREQSCTLAVFNTRAVTATFLADPVTAHVVGDPNLVITVNGANCSPSCDRLYERGTVVTFEAQPIPGRIFTGWTGDCASSANASCTLTMNADKTVSAIAVVESYVVSVFFGGDLAGSEGFAEVVISWSTGSQSCFSGCTVLVPPGETVTIGAAGFDGYYFAGFDGDCGDQGSPCTLTADRDLSMTAYFYFDWCYFGWC